MALLYGLRMGGLTQGKTLQQMGAMHSADGGDAFGRWERCIRQTGEFEVVVLNEVNEE